MKKVHNLLVMNFLYIKNKYLDLIQQFWIELDHI